MTAEHHHISRQVEVVPFPASSLESYEEIEKHFTNNKFPGVWQISDTNFYEFTHSAGVPTISIVLDLSTQRKENDAILEQVKSVVANRGFHVGVIDGVAWSESLKDFSIFKHELPRVLITVDDFTQWYEDKDLLSLEAVLSVAKDSKTVVKEYKDLPAHEGLKRALLEDYIGGSFLIYGQSRNQYSKAMWYVREFSRFSYEWFLYAQTGPVPMGAFTLVVVGLVAFFLFAIYVSYLIVRAVVTSFFESDEEGAETGSSNAGSPDDNGKAVPGAMKKTQ